MLVGRLDDAAFAHRRDLERGLEAMAAELGRVSFLEGSGSLADKVARLGPIVERLCDRKRARRGRCGPPRSRAAALCKADLVSGLVSEFADLEGYAGSLYARAAGEDEAVCAAIEEHHRPREAGGELPASEAGAVLALADKADTLAVAFGLGLEPTGSRDPFGLRRAAAGIVAIALDRGYALDPHDLLGERAAGFVLDRLEPLAARRGRDGRGGARGPRVGGGRAGRRGRARPGAARVRRAAAATPSATPTAAACASPPRRRPGRSTTRC